MKIDLNGMIFHLNIFDDRAGSGYRAEIVDEAFSFPVTRGRVHDLDTAASFVRAYAGIAPRAAALSMIAERFQALHAAQKPAAPIFADQEYRQAG